MAEAAETRAYNRRMKELAAEDEARREGLLSKVFGFSLLEATKVLILRTGERPMNREPGRLDATRHGRNAEQTPSKGYGLVFAVVTRFP